MSSTKSRDSALNAIKRYMRTSKGASANAVDQEVIATYLQLLEEQWSRFCDAQEKVELSCGDEAIAVEEQSRMQAEEWYTTAKANFKRAIKERNVVPTGDTPTAYAAVQLPKMELPIFSGDHTDWLNFHDSFNQLVHSNASLSNGQKLHYLRGCLKGEALELINGLSVCDVNYGAAWDLLTKRFKSMRVIVDSHIKALFAIPKASKDCAKDIKCVLNPTSQHTGALRSLGRPVGSWDDWLVHLTVSKLAYETRKQWELSLVNDVLPSFASLSDFLEIRARSLEMLSASTINIKNAKSVLTCEQQAVTYHPPPKNTALLHCTFCNCNHKIYSCKKLVQLNAVAKLAAICERNACINCLCKGHTAEKCNSNSLCRICQQRHHTSLHGSFNHYSPCSTSDAAEDEPAQTSSHTASHPPDADRVILLATAQVQLQDCAGRWQPARALFDNGSHASFITEACVQRLRLRRTASSAFITGIGSTRSGQAKGEVKVVVSPRSQEQRIPINVLILSKITNDLPPFQLPTSSWPHLLDLPLADTHFTVPGPIDVLIGMDEMDKFLLDGLRKGPNGTPMAQRTAFGWVVFGNTTNSANASTNIKSLHCDTRLTKLVAKFFELEEPQERKHYSAEENFCEKLFEETTQRAADGRFIVRLPLKEEIKLGESRNAAVRGLLRMERKFESDERLYEAYCNFMQELIILGHMEPANDSTSKTYYMPHRAVLKSTSATTKLRVVFNASMKTSSGFSLNDALMIGPQLQQDLFSILVRFRTHRLALIADVEKMYRQVYVAKQDVDFQRIVWRRNSTEPIRDYRLLRVTYGVAAASHLAVKSLQQAAIEAGEAYRKTANVIINDFYMDDLLTGSETSECLSALQQDISHVLSQRGFELRKWATNCDQLRRKIPNVSKNVSHLLAEGDEVRTLGIIWHTNDDWLSIAVDLEELPVRITKRLFLSDSSKIFDPLGLIAPCTIRSKILLQKLWRANVDWDEAIPPEVMSEWLVHRNELPMLSSLKLARWLGTNTTAETEYHVFTDASEAAYAAVVYCRTQHPNGVINVELVAARTKVAPLKSTTLPRLELCGAHLGARLMKQVSSSFETKPCRLFGWTDSMVTLAWLQADSRRWSVFVANRVADVQEILPSECWKHVSSEHNPADCASRGASPSQLLSHGLWWNGPHWLRENTPFWLNTITQQTTDLKSKSCKPTSHISQASEEWSLLTRFSSFSKLKRVTAYVLKFISNSRKNLLPRKEGHLSSAEILSAERALVKYVQFIEYSNEISSCRSNKPVPMRSSLLRLQPFLDSQGILRVGGRIRQSALFDDAKHPIILPKGASLAKLIAVETHIITLHAGPQIMQSVIQRRFWVTGLRSLVRAIYRSCVRCKRLNHQPIQQVMSDLPPSRVTNARPFLHSAVDFAGPFSVKFSAGRGAKTVKAYICSYICMSTGAMHLELTSDLSAATFLAAFKRFVNRRGLCRDIYSDNGTNFVGAEKALRIAYQRCLHDGKVSRYFADRQITWHFNPPSAPHMGGFWEAGVERVKYHLKRALGSSLFTYEEFTTLLTEVEACVNSRPICQITTDVDDLDALTPGHFLLGEPLKGLPEIGGAEFKGSLYQRWQAISAARQHFWERWRDEYLVNLQRRTKWFRPTSNLEEGDVVVIHDANVPPTKWKLGRVLDCRPGPDGRVRVVNLKTSEGELLRPVAKLSLLPTKNVLFAV